MITKSSPELLTPEDLAYISTLNECTRRQFLRTKAICLHEQGFSISKVSKIMKVSKNTLYKDIRELRTGNGPGKDRVRRQDGGRNTLLHRHPEWVKALKVVIEPYTTGRAQDTDVIWVSLSTLQISRELSKNGYDVSEYIARQIIDFLISIETKKKEFNPIEHQLFAHVTRSWSRAPLLSVNDAAQRAARTTIKKGLTVYVNANSKTYDIKRPIEEQYEKKMAQ